MDLVVVRRHCHPERSEASFAKGDFIPEIPRAARMTTDLRIAGALTSRRDRIGSRFRSRGLLRTTKGTHNPTTIARCSRAQVSIRLTENRHSPSTVAHFPDQAY